MRPWWALRHFQAGGDITMWGAPVLAVSGGKGIFRLMKRRRKRSSCAMQMMQIEYACWVSWDMASGTTITHMGLFYTVSVNVSREPHSLSSCTDPRHTWMFLQAFASTLSAEKQGKPKALVACVSLKQGNKSKSERTDDCTGGKIVVDLSGWLNKCDVICPRHGVQPRGWKSSRTSC